jgi:PKD repeat protein
MKIKFGTFLIVSILLSNPLSAQTVVVKKHNDRVLLWMEAEAGAINAPMMVHDTEVTSGGQFIEVKSGNNNTENAPEDGHAIYKFTVENAGTYKVWGRVRIDMADEDAFWVKMDDDNWVKWKGIEVGCKWHWDEVHDNQKNNQVMTYNLDAGAHTLDFTYCMDQTRLDKLLITNDLDYVPTAEGPRANALYTCTSTKPSVNESVRFDGSASSSTEGTITTYAWEFNGEKTASGVTANHTFKEAGKHDVKLIVTDNMGLTSRVTKTVTVYTNKPVVHFDYSPDRSKSSEVVTFDASSSFDPNGKIVSYSWDFGDGTTGEGVVVKHPYTSAGEYSTTLTVTDSEGMKVTETRLVTVIAGIPKKIIFETDMCLDVDDVGALATLHALANNSEVDLLAVCFNEIHPGGASAIDAINSWYGRGDIPVGIYKKDLAAPDKSDYLDALKKFPHDLDQESASSAVDVYTKVLSKQDDKSVTIISVGFLNNLYDLLKAEPDLVAQKVNELVVMGGVNNDGFNLSRHNLVSASEYVIRNWPSPLVISQPGSHILTGERLENSPEENPVRDAYFQFFNSNFCGRPSWDQVAVLYGVRGLSDYFSRNTTGTGSLQNGYKWQMNQENRSFLEALLPWDSYAKIIQDLMLEPPVK